jgi:hypothetical protein
LLQQQAQAQSQQAINNHAKQLAENALGMP